MIERDKMVRIQLLTLACPYAGRFVINLLLSGFLFNDAIFGVNDDSVQIYGKIGLNINLAVNYL